MSLGVVDIVKQPKLLIFSSNCVWLIGQKISVVSSVIKDNLKKKYFYLWFSS